MATVDNEEQKIWSYRLRDFTGLRNCGVALATVLVTDTIDQDLHETYSFGDWKINMAEGWREKNANFVDWKTFAFYCR